MNSILNVFCRFVLLICQQCGQSFRKSEDFEAHHRICVGEDGDNEGAAYNDMDGDLNSSYSGDNSNSQVESPMDTELGKYECVFCDGHYISRDNLRKHLILRHQLIQDNSNPKWFSCKYCDKDFPDRKVVLEHEITHTGKAGEAGKFLCSQCGKNCRSRSALVEHLCLHTGGKPYSCPHCGKTCSGERGVKEHIKRVHQGGLGRTGKQLTCEYCYVIFVTRQDLIDHLKDIHNVVQLSRGPIADRNARNFVCSECGKEFDHKLKHSFIEHIATHTRSDLHSCGECGKTFVRERELRYHKARHRGEGRYVCGLCNKNFVLKWDLKKHLKTIHDIDEDGSFDKIPHKRIRVSPGEDNSMVMADIMKVNPYICRICHAQFDDGKELRAHKNTHVDEDMESIGDQIAGIEGAFPFICSFCSKGFQDKNDFVVHVGSHTKGTIGQYHTIGKSTPKSASNLVVFTPSPTKRAKRAPDGGDGVDFWKCCFGMCRKDKDATVYTSKEELREHVTMHMEQNPSVCEHCGRCFTRPRDLVYHKKVQGIRPCKYLPIVDSNEGKDPNQITSPLSGLSLSKKLALLQHPRALEGGEVPPSLKLHTCGCGKKVQGFKEFQLHVLTHKSDDSCSFCQYCGESFTDHLLLRETHLKESCENPCKYAPFALNGEDPDDVYGEDAGTSQNGSGLVSNGDGDDDESYSMVLNQSVNISVSGGNMSMLPEPKQTRGTDDKPFACRFCGKTFRARSYVREHETVHTKEANFQCEMCDRRFTRARELRAHQRKHDGKEQWVCDQCPKRFLNQVQYRLHMEKSHEAESTGGEDAVAAGNIMANVNIVDNAMSSELPTSFKCALCSKQFNHLDHFKAHMEIVHDVEVSVVQPGDEDEEEETMEEDDDEDDEMDDSREELVAVVDVVQAVAGIDGVVEIMEES